MLLQAKNLSLVVCALALILTACDDSTVSPEEPASSDDQQERVEPAPLYSVTDTSAVPDKYIVVFEPGTPGLQRQGVQGQAEQMMQGIAGGEIEFTYENVIQGFSATIPEQALDGIRNNPNVKHVEQDQSVQPDDGIDQSPPWQLDRVDQRNLPLQNQYRYFGTGAGTEIWVLDSGLNYHEEFGDRISTRMSIVSDGNGPADCLDVNGRKGHGTQVASAAAGSEYGVAKEATISSIRIGDCPSGNSTTSRQIAALEHVEAFHQPPAVANLSYSVSGGLSFLIAAGNLWNSGVPLVVSAGNDNMDACDVGNGNVPAIAVGGIDQNDDRSDYIGSQASNYGECVDLFAPGSGLTLASSTSETGHSTKSGTSFSAPMVAGAAALVFESNPGFSAGQVSDYIAENTTTNVLGDIGPGSPDRLLHTVDFDAEIFGTTYVYEPDTYTWTAQLQNQGSSQTYLWERKDGPSWSSSPWETVGTSQDYSETVFLDGNDFTLRLTVVSNNYEVVDQQTVGVELDDGDECEPGQITC